jgi:hypothetical protein
MNIWHMTPIIITTTIPDLHSTTQIFNIKKKWRNAAAHSKIRNISRPNMIIMIIISAPPRNLFLEDQEGYGFPVTRESRCWSLFGENCLASRRSNFPYFYGQSFVLQPYVRRRGAWSTYIGPGRGEEEEAYCYDLRLNRILHLRIYMCRFRSFSRSLPFQLPERLSTSPSPTSLTATFSSGAYLIPTYLLLEAWKILIRRLDSMSRLQESYTYVTTKMKASSKSKKAQFHHRHQLQTFQK